MRGIRVLVFCLLFQVFALHAADIKIGFVNAAKILDEAPQAVAARKLLEEEFAPRDRGLIDAQKSLRDLEDKLANEGANMSETQRRRLERDIRTKRVDLRRSRDEFLEDFNMRRNEEIEKLQRRVYEAIINLAKEENFDLIVNDGAVIYASEQVDITSQVLQLLK